MLYPIELRTLVRPAILDGGPQTAKRNSRLSDGLRDGRVKRRYRLVADLHAADNASRKRGEFCELLGLQVDDAAGHIWSTVVHDT